MIFITAVFLVSPQRKLLWIFLLFLENQGHRLSSIIFSDWSNKRRLPNAANGLHSSLNRREPLTQMACLSALYYLSLLPIYFFCNLWECVFSISCYRCFVNESHISSDQHCTHSNTFSVWKHRFACLNIKSQSLEIVSGDWCLSCIDCIDVFLEFLLGPTGGRPALVDFFPCKESLCLLCCFDAIFQAVLFLGATHWQVPHVLFRLLNGTPENFSPSA